MQTIIVKQGQSILDIAIIYTGDALLSFQIAIANNLAITDEIFAGQSLIVPSVEKKNIVGLFNAKDQPATAIKNLIDDTIEPQLEGIGYWIIGDDNIVS